MSAPAVIRVFFAIDVPGTVKERIGQFITELRKKAKSNGIRWTKPENLHITLQFIPKLQTEHLENLLANVKAEMEGVIEGASFEFGKIQLLPSPFMPRVIVLGVERHKNLDSLATIIGHGIQNTNYAIESRPFRAHITLGRIKHTQTNLDFLNECAVPTLEPQMIKEVILFRSDPAPDGSKYTPVETIELSYLPSSDCRLG